MGGIFFFSCLWFFYGCYNNKPPLVRRGGRCKLWRKWEVTGGGKSCCCCIWQAVLSNHPSSFASTYGLRKWLCIQACQVNLRCFHYQIVSVGKVHLFPLENNPKTNKNKMHRRVSHLMDNIVSMQSFSLRMLRGECKSVTPHLSASVTPYSH